MTLGSILMIVLVLMLIGAMPTWSYSRSWGYGPTGVLGAIFAVILVMALLGVLPIFPGHAISMH